MKKHLFPLLFSLCLLLAALSPLAFAAETEETTAPTEETADILEQSRATSGTCGDGLTWRLEGVTLTVSGSGEMDDGSPWEFHKDKIHRVVFTGGVTYVGEGAFQGYEELTEVDFGDSMKRIGVRAFQDCTGLESIRLPSTFRRFHAECFMGCTALETVYCDGPMPSFNGNCLWNGNHITIYTPINNPWPQDLVQELTDNFGGRLEIVAGGTEYEPPAETAAPPATEAPTEETTVPETQPETTAATEAPTEAPTEIPTQPPTQAPPATEATLPQWLTEPTEPAALEDERLSGSIIAALLIAGTLTLLLTGGLIFRRSSRKGGRYQR